MKLIKSEADGKAPQQDINDNEDKDRIIEVPFTSGFLHLRLAAETRNELALIKALAYAVLGSMVITELLRAAVLATSDLVSAREESFICAACDCTDSEIIFVLNKPLHLDELFLSISLVSAC